MRPHSRSFVLFLAVALAVGGCTTGTSGPTPITGALTSGRVESSAGASAGVTVRAYAVEPDGTMTEASEPAETSADGRYSLRVDLPDTATRLVVRVEDGSERMTALGRAAIEASGTSSIVLSPIDRTSTFEAAVDLALEASDDVSIHEAETTALFLSHELAARLAARADVAGTVTATASAIARARTTFLAALSADALGGGSGDLALMLRESAEAEAHLSASLDAATTADEVRAASGAYFDAVVGAAIDVGYSADGAAAAAIAASASLESSLSGLVSAGASECEELEAFAVTAAVDAGAMAGVDAGFAAAGASLRTSIVAMAEAGASADAVAAAWASYETTLEAAIQSRITASGSLTLVTDLVAEIDGSAEALLSAWAALGAEASADARIEAFASYRGAVTSTEHVSALVEAGLTEVEAEAALDALACIHAAMS